MERNIVEQIIEAMMDWTATLPTFIITLREGVEAALVVGIVLSLLRQTQRNDLTPWVWSAVITGIVASGITGACFRLLFFWVQQSHSFSSEVIEPLLKVGFTLMAIALLSWMLLWMTEQARSMKSSIEGELQTLLAQETGAGWAIFGLVCIAVLREGFETAVFLTSQEQTGWNGMIGAIAGGLGAIFIGWMLFTLGIKLNLKRFFQIMGGFLILIVAGLVMSLCKSLDVVMLTLVQIPRWQGMLCIFEPNSNTSCLWGPLIWNGQGILPEHQFPGLLLKALLGYRDRIYLIQGFAYLSFLIVLTRLYLQRLAINIKTIGSQETVPTESL